MSIESKLNKPISWLSTDPDIQLLLSNLQGNILKGHGRDNARLLFIRFTAPVNEVRKALSGLSVHVVSALEQLQASKTFKETGVGGRTFVSVFLTPSGYAALGVEDSRIPSNVAYRTGLKGRGGILNDPAVETWDSGLQQPIDALILIADDVAAKVATVADEIGQEINLVATTVFVQEGSAIRNDDGEGIEHFGYVDGRSQPLLLQEDIDAEKAALLKEDPSGIKWDPAFPPIPTALVKDPASDEITAYGSYFVFRKLEQNVRGFKAREIELAARLNLTGDDAERAGGLVVGRFENGTPVTLEKEEGEVPVRNNFNFDADPSGGKCPFHAHIRKTNPRGSGPGGLADERKHIMPRRGIPYGERATTPNDPILEGQPELFPSGGVGLLFMAYQNEIERQFEFTQAAWVNNKEFPAEGTGLDPVLGQGDAEPQLWPPVWGQPASDPRTPFTFADFVSLRGGEYFFAPSLAFLKTL